MGGWGSGEGCWSGRASCGGSVGWGSDCDEIGGWAGSAGRGDGELDSEGTAAGLAVAERRDVVLRRMLGVLVVAAVGEGAVVAVLVAATSLLVLLRGFTNGGVTYEIS